MADLADTPAMAIERSCSLTAVALSDERRAGVRLVTGAEPRIQPEFCAHIRARPVSAARARLDAENADMRYRTSMFAVEGPAGRVPVERVVGARARGR